MYLVPGYNATKLPMGMFPLVTITPLPAPGIVLSCLLISNPRALYIALFEFPPWPGNCAQWLSFSLLLCRECKTATSCSITWESGIILSWSVDDTSRTVLCKTKKTNKLIQEKKTGNCHDTGFVTHYHNYDKKIMMPFYFLLSLPTLG